MTAATRRRMWVVSLSIVGVVFAVAGYSVNGVPGMLEGFVIGVIGGAIVWFFQL